MPFKGQHTLDLLKHGPAELRRAAENSGNLGIGEKLALCRALVISGEFKAIRRVLEPVATDNLEVADRIAAISFLAMSFRRDDPPKAMALMASVESMVARCADPLARANWSLIAGLLDMDSGKALAAESRYHEALRDFRSIDEILGVSWVCNTLGNLLFQIGHVDDAKAFIRKSLEIKEKHGDSRGRAISHGSLGRCEYAQGHLEAASREYHADLELSRQIGDTAGEAQMLCSLGEIALEKNNYAEAERLFEEAARAHVAPINLAHAHAGMAMAALERGDLNSAQASADKSRGLHGADSPWVAGYLATVDAMVLHSFGDTAGGIRLIRQTLDRLTAPTDVFTRIKLLYRLRDLLELAGQDAEAVRVMSEVLDKLCLCGADAEVGDLRRWMQRKDNAGTIKLALSRSFPPFLVDDIIGGNLLSPGQRKEHSRRQDLTVLFTDIRDFTVISQSMAPDELLDMLSDWFRETTKIVQAHGGLVDKFVGDAMMALFGVPDGAPDAAVRACRAALDIQQANRMRNLRREALENGVRFRVGVGIARGDAVVGFLGSHLRLSFTAIGTTVNLASRLEGATKEVPDAHILVNDAVALDPLVAADIAMAPVPPVDLKGIGPTPVWSVLGKNARKPSS